MSGPALVTRASAFRRSRALVVPPVLAAVFTLAACGSGGGNSGGDPQHMDHMGGDDEASPIAEGARRVEVSAGDFAFDPKGINADEGEDLEIVLTSGDIFHDFVIDELDVHVSAARGETKSGGIPGTDAGRYTYYCSVPGHRSAGMEGTLIVS